MQQLQISFDPVHARENNSLSQSHLEQYKSRFTASCYNVLVSLVSGERLTVVSAVTSGLSTSLPRRIKDLRDYGISISSQWVITANSRYLEYYMTQEDKAKSFQFLLTKSQLAA